MFDDEEEALYKRLQEVCGGENNRDSIDSEPESCCNKLYYFFFGKK